MEEIHIIDTVSVSHGWNIQVGIGDNKYTVRISSDKWEEITKKTISPEQFVMALFHFLLDRESIDTIMAVFDLSIVEANFPNFSEQIKEYF